MPEEPQPSLYQRLIGTEPQTGRSSTRIPGMEHILRGMIGAVGEPTQQAKQQKEEEDQANDARLEHAVLSHPDPNVRADSMMQVMKKHKVKPEVQGVLLKMLGVLGEGLKGAASFGAYPQIMERREEQERQSQLRQQEQAQQEQVRHRTWMEEAPQRIAETERAEQARLAAVGPTEAARLAQKRADDIIRANQRRIRLEQLMRDEHLPWTEASQQVALEMGEPYPPREPVTGERTDLVTGTDIGRDPNKVYRVTRRADGSIVSIFEAPPPKLAAQIPGRDIPFSPEVEQQKIRITDAAAKVRGAALNQAASEDVAAVVEGIKNGTLPPDLRGFYRNRVPIEAGLQRAGVDLTTATRDWQAINRYIGTLNSNQQVRLRQAIDFAYETLPQLEDAYEEWKKQAGISGYKILNRATLALMKQLPGAAGSSATQLDALIADFTSEMGTAYKGGNSSTDETLRLAAENLKGEWNDQTFKDAVARLKRTLGIRRNSIVNAGVAGVSGGSPYVPPVAIQGTSGTGVLPKPSRPGELATEEVIQAYILANGNDPARAKKALSDAGYTWGGK